MARIIAYCVVGFILLPNIIIIIASFSELRFITFPPSGFTIDWYVEALHRQEFLASFRTSLLLSATVTAIGTVIALMTALSLRVLTGPVRNWAVGVVMSPLMLPGIVIGIALLQFFSLLRVPTSGWTLVLGHLVITIPYAVRLITDSLSALPRNLEAAASSLGANPLRTVLAVVIPCIKPGVIAGALFVFIVSFENITISIFLAAPQTMTLPVRIFGYTEQGVETWLVAICSMTILFTLLLMGIIERFIGVRRIIYATK
ncbi:ABC transporter permease [Acuticoccus mangrovi]|uniref:ABC transporter permease n=1 Tax=Acuticoccus mangrovi TaxID=2796142 RepID=A0A934IPG1_9HYPH|nr:ABC transporter permease [Acuticoccus mangrovi]MBJ3775650.1 ABC transporter permease [Acuticoccus mangrovi]